MVATYNDATSWAELFMLPHCVLCPLHGAAANTNERQRPTLWTASGAGMRGSAWNFGAATPSRPLRGHGTTAGARLQRVWHGKASIARLVRRSWRQACAATAAALRGLHPPGRLVPPAPNLPPAIEVALDSVHCALQLFALDSAPGPSGLRVQHLLDACTPGSSDGFLQQLTAVVNLLGQGRACAEVATFLAGASLAAVPKPSGGVRPLAVGEVLRRLVGKCLMGAIRDDARAFFWPTQVGVAIKSGAEKAVHAARRWHSRQGQTADRV